RLNLYEQAMASYVLAAAVGAEDGKNWHKALTHARHAVIDRGNYLEPAIKPAAIDLNVLLEAKDGNYLGALCTYRRERAAGTNLSQQTVQIGENIASLVSAPAPLVVPAEIVAEERPNIPAQWVHPMLRHKFSFSAVKGNVKGFRLQCMATVLDSPV